MKRRADDIAYDGILLDKLTIRYEDFILKGAQTTMHVSFPRVGGGDGIAPVPTRGTDLIPRRL